MILPVAQHVTMAVLDGTCDSLTIFVITESVPAFASFNKFYSLVVPYTVVDHEAGSQVLSEQNLAKQTANGLRRLIS